MNQNTNYRYKFSIITAVYNAENYLPEAIESIVNQNIGFHDSVELILVDDGSPDRSGEICDSYRAKYPGNIKVIHKKNGGVSSARNAGIRVAEGRYINFMDSDDMLSPGSLSAVFDFFSATEQEIDLVSIPIFFFEGKNIPHRLNYKYASGLNQIIDLEKQYSFVQMSAASSFFKRESLSTDFFDTSLCYAEDAKAIMGLFLGNPRYGIVPAGRYLYRFRNTMNSALNSSRQRKEWYLDCLQNYILWSIKESLKKFGYVPKFVQYNLMYDLQSRFRMEEFPEDVLTDNEKTKFTELLKTALSNIDDQIILEQRNLSKEQKDYAISLKREREKTIYEYFNDDGRLRYDDTVTHPLSSYVLKIKKLEINYQNIYICGSVKLNCKFPYPSQIYIRLTSGNKISRITCSYEPDPERIFRSMGKTLAQFTNFEASFPRKLLSGKTKLEFCMTCDSHEILFRNLLTEDTFPVPQGEKKVYIESKRIFITYSKKDLILEPISLRKHFKKKYNEFKNKKNTEMRL